MAQLTTNQLAVLTVCSVLNEATGKCSYTQASQYADESEVIDLITRGLIQQKYLGNVVLVMELTAIGKCHLLNLTKQPIY